MTKTVSEADVALFADLTGDSSPLHLDEDCATRTRFKGKMAHGILSAGWISAVLGTKLPEPGSVYLSRSLNLLKPVRIGDTITATVGVSRISEKGRVVTLETGCTTQDGVEVLEGEATLLIEEVRE